MTQKLSVKDGF